MLLLGHRPGGSFAEHTVASWQRLGGLGLGGLMLQDQDQAGSLVEGPVMVTFPHWETKKTPIRKLSLFDI